MNLQIRNPRAYDLARRLAAMRGTSMTEAVIEALEAEVKRRRNAASVLETVKRLQEELRRLGRPGGHMMTKSEIDAMWGHEPDDLDGE